VVFVLTISSCQAAQYIKDAMESLDDDDDEFDDDEDME
jgi:hypothetical protein